MLSRCSRCGQPIQPGDAVDRQGGPHVYCPVPAIKVLPEEAATREDTLTRALTPAEIEERRKELRAVELLTAPRTVWYVSFAKDKDEGGWQGGAFVMAHGVTTALDRCNELGINPGGSVMALEAPEPVFPELMDRLLNIGELVAAFGKLTRGVGKPCACSKCNEAR
jgi:hypothetical protein